MIGIGTIAAIGAAAGAARGIGQAVAAKRSFSPEMEKEMGRLMRQRAAGELGLSDVRRQALEADLQTQRAQALQQSEAMADQRAQARGGNVSARDIFLAEAAAKDAALQSQVEAAKIISAEEAQARQVQETRLQNLQNAQAQSRAGVVQGLLGGAADAAGASAQILSQKAMRDDELKLKAQLAREEMRMAALSQGADPSIFD